ncbi:MAG TPA: efflux RND transporter periplasmic adaptor subunit [Steroidobacteraceae bacterium]|nr:efflux RND transporter periplasmic adaptor subunit [Steroidobacteraceae bacterium]
MIARTLLLIVMSLTFTACGEPARDHGEETGLARGPHRGRLLSDGNFALELTIFEENTAPEFRLYAYDGGKPIAPAGVTGAVEITRLDGQVTRFELAAEGEYLRGDGEVAEPHSFDVKVFATYEGKSHKWSFESHEGRTQIPASVAAEAGVVVETAGSAVIRDEVRLVGTVMLNADRHAHVEARFPGTVRAVHVHQGDKVRRGQTLLVVEANESMREYPVTAPFDGVVLARRTNVGDIASGGTLIEIADLSEVWVELHAIGSAAARIGVGQTVRIDAATTDLTATTTISTLLPLATRGQTVIARARLPNKNGRWLPGMMVEADVAVASREVPLAVRESGLQRFREFTVVFAQYGDTYEVRMLTLGARDGEFAEVLGGLAPGTPYVTGQSFLIKADIEKSGAGHDH